MDVGVRMHEPHQFEAKALCGLNSKLHELLLLLRGQYAGAVAASLIEVGLHSGPVVGNGPIYSLPFTEDQVHVHFRSIQILFKHECQLDPAVRIALHQLHVCLSALLVMLISKWKGQC